MKRLRSIGQYFVHAIILLLSFILPFFGFLFIGWAMKKQDPTMKLYSSCGVLLAFLFYIVQFIV